MAGDVVGGDSAGYLGSSGRVAGWICPLAGGTCHRDGAAWV